MNGLSEITLDRSFLDDLTLLTLGPQLRGGANVQIGERGILKVFDAIKAIVASHIIKVSTRDIEIRNAAGRAVLIKFAADPDIVIREKLSGHGEDYRNIIAIEVKGGTDFSNIHNRIGEAEKSHQKAKSQGYTECWTVVNVVNFDLAKAKRGSPSTNQFYLLSTIISGKGSDFESFQNRILSLTGIPNKPTTSGKKRR
jgi:hypothetical protein